MTRNFMNWSSKLSLSQRERDGGGGQPPVKSQVRAQSNTVGRLRFFWGGRCSRISGWTPEARSRICVCRASFLMTFVQSGMPPRLPAHDKCSLVAAAAVPGAELVLHRHAGDGAGGGQGSLPPVEIAGLVNDE